MPTNQYLAFGVGVGANVLTPASYAASSLLPIGHQPGVALSEVANTTWRQTSVAAAGIAAMVNDLAALDMLDDGSVTNYKNGVIAAIRALVLEKQFWAPGDVKGTLNSTIPAGWLVAQGQVVSRTTYAALFAAIGTTYGAGDGSTTFALPDLRGEFLRGLDSGRGVDSGRTLGSAQADMIEAHKHVVPQGERDQAIFGGTSTQVYNGIGMSDTSNPRPHTNDGSDYDGTTNPAGLIGSETRPRNVAVLWLIKT
jgi:microcystin-dependent protein